MSVKTSERVNFHNLTSRSVKEYLIVFAVKDDNIFKFNETVPSKF